MNPPTIPPGIPIDGVISKGCFVRRHPDGWTLYRGGQVWTGIAWTIWSQDGKVLADKDVAIELAKAVDVR